MHEKDGPAAGGKSSSRRVLDGRLAPWCRAGLRLSGLAAAVSAAAFALPGAPVSASVASTYPSSAPLAGIASTPTGKGYWQVASDGGIFAFGDAGFYGSTGGKPLNAPVAGIAATPDGKGYWEVASDGGIFAFGDAGFYGSMGGKPLNAPVAGIAATPDGKGYWEVASDGGIFAFGDAGFYGSMGGKPLNAPVAGIAATPDGKGYWEVASDGGVFAFGDAPFDGSMGGKVLNAPVAGITAHHGGGYWETASDGGVFAFGAPFDGSMGGQILNAPVVGIAATPDGGGYWETAYDGGVFAFGDAAYYGSAHYAGPAKPPLGSAASYASQILANSSIIKSGRLVQTDLQDAAAGRVGSSGAPLSATLLSLIAGLGQKHTVTLTALESGGTGHTAGSLHYSGDAVDIGALDGATVTGRNAPSITIIVQLERLLPPGSAFGQSECGATPPLPEGISTFQDTCNHLHIQVPRGTP